MYSLLIDCLYIPPRAGLLGLRLVPTSPQYLAASVAVDQKADT